MIDDLRLRDDGRSGASHAEGGDRAGGDGAPAPALGEFPHYLSDGTTRDLWLVLT